MSVSAVSSAHSAPPPQPVKPVSQVKGSDPDGDGDNDAGKAETSSGADPYSGKNVDTRA